jgi:hypothetical protein
MPAPITPILGVVTRLPFLVASTIEVDLCVALRLLSAAGNF